MCRHINLLWCATIISSAAAGATLLEVQEAAVGDEDESAAPSDTLIKKKHIFIGNLVRLFLSEGSSWIVN